MIEKFNGSSTHYNELLYIISNCNTEDFYLTENNERVFINNKVNLKKLIKQSYQIYFLNDYDMERFGVILVWKSVGGETIRNYVKVVSNSYEATRDLITALLWNYNNEIYTKIKKDSSILKAFYSKGFRFEGGRGTQVLLKRTKSPYTPTIMEKDKEHVSNLQHNSF